MSIRFMDVMYVLWLYLLIGLIWAGAEKLFYGVSTPRLIDDVVADHLGCRLIYLVSIVGSIINGR